MFWSESGEKSEQIKQCLQAKTVQNSSKQICGWILMWETTGLWLFHWRKRCYGLWTHILAGNNGLKLNTPWWICFSFCLLQMLTDGLEWCGLLWCFYQLFGHSFWRHPFTAEQVMQCYISPNLMKKQTHLLLGWPEGEHIFSKFSFLGELFL